MTKKKIMLVFGTRPEAIKMCPLILECQRRPDRFDVVVCLTGQHAEMLTPVLDYFQIKPDYNLEVMKEEQTLTDVTVEVLTKLGPVLENEKPDFLLVHGDTTTTFAGALAAFYRQIPVGHVEAGLRTYDFSSPYPEEFNRQCAGILAGYHFAPTEWAAQNLIEEKKDPVRVFVTGNTVLDAIGMTIRKEYSHPDLDWAEGSQLILVTAHRRENLGKPMEQMFAAIRRIVDDYPDVKVIYPIHKNPKVRRIADLFLRGHERVRLIEPLEVFDFHNFMSRCHIILTDSGGLQEEASAVKKPVLLMRNTTERPEGVEAGIIDMVGTGEEAIYNAASRLLHDTALYEKMISGRNPFGDGFASRRIVDILEAVLL
ncbi:MAG: UDP-N-acetylglucosamine 2-epimerase (non-hydrolyzing) [Peptococcaceae bacterium]|jgi:UDP-N-acetylglucosamine 2-epimerase (non-hydrolysing)|nr:UDP-N-acetylglucosamine 2-epimerase (non-hydrolyzing) [Peptococcaceae bacterium]